MTNYATLGQTPLKPLLTNHINASTQHLGQMGDQFPLSFSQRESLHHLFTLERGDILAINGPPGTGKTTLLHSVVANLWVKAALREKDPPVIVAASHNNQAVTNVIESFNSSVKRWLPKIKSFGLYGPSQKRERKTTKYQTLNKFSSYTETEKYFHDAYNYFIRQYHKHFNQDTDSLQVIADTLHKEIKAKTDIIHDGIQLYLELQSALSKIGSEKQLIDRIVALSEDLSRCIIKVERIENILEGFIKHINTEPFWMTILSFLPPIRFRVHMRNLEYLTKFEINIAPPDNKVILDYLNKLKDTQDKNIKELKTERKKKKRQLSYYQQIRTKYLNWCKIHSINPENLLEELDSKMRYPAFELSTHYWEARWLIERKEEISTSFKESKSRIKQKKKWRRYMKLTPCFVSTLQMLPKHFMAWEGVDMPLYEFIDLLIIDEAGQVSSETAGASFALAQKALIVGDILQIEPVWDISSAIDRSNIKKFGLAKTNEEIERFLDSGRAASTGCVMKIAQDRSSYKKYERGMFLSEHRRCVPEIINYCNKLAYKGKLEPKRNSIENYILPHMGYLHIKGFSETVMGSRRNNKEASIIVQWVLNNRKLIENYYKDNIENLLAVVTPFSKQTQALKKYFSQRGLKKITVGTVHALQGAERKIVIFSPVYGDNDTNFFFDKNVNMLNVAVSRAKDSFLVFGNKTILRPSGTPSGVLSSYLFAKPENEICTGSIKDANILAQS